MKKFVNRIIDFFKPPTGWGRRGALSPEMLKTVENTRAAQGDGAGRGGFGPL